MTISMYQASAPVFLRQLEVLDALLVKGAAFAAENGMDEAELTETRLAPDMFPLARQVQFASDAVKGAMARLAGSEIPSWPDEEKGFEELRGRVAKTRAYVESFSADQIDGCEDRPVVLKFPNGQLDMVGQSYLLHFALPNFLFHVTTAYAILRSKGVSIGKMDFLGSF